MRINALVVLSLCVAASQCASPARASERDNANIDLSKAMQDIADKIKETTEQTASAVTQTTEQVKQAIGKLQHELEEHQKPIEDTLSQAAHDVCVRYCAVMALPSPRHLPTSLAQLWGRAERFTSLCVPYVFQHMRMLCASSISVLHGCGLMDPVLWIQAKTNLLCLNRVVYRWPRL